MKRYIKYAWFFLLPLFLSSCETDTVVVTILSPQDGQIFNFGQEIAFSGSAMDSSGGELGDESLVWTSSADGRIGTGTGFEKDDLSTGNHIITLTGTDSLGKTGSDTITISVLSEGTGQLKLESESIIAGEMIPVKYTCDGENVSPALMWANVPEGTESFVIIMDDPDAPAGSFTHWLVFDIPDSVDSLEEEFPEKSQTAGIKEGLTDFGTTGYKGPCPPRSGGAHRYYIWLYALDVETFGLPYGAERSEVEAGMQGHILDQAYIMEEYKRQ
jgi:Raf kinase inhibitor-like YbhB/YbcL family protein